MDNNGVKKPFFDSPTKFYIFSRLCVSGEKQTEEGTCIECPIGTYMIVAPERTIDCKQCDPNAMCFGKNMTAPKDGYFRSSKSSETIIKCFNGQACLKGSREFQTGECAEGYNGFMCSACQENYYKFN